MLRLCFAVKLQRCFVDHESINMWVEEVECLHHWVTNDVQLLSVRFMYNLKRSARPDKPSRV